MPRILCEKCQRPQSVCLCAHFVSLKAPCRLLILQHPTEQKQPLATVPIIQQCIDPCEVWVGEDFSGREGLESLQAQASKVRVLFPSANAETWVLPPASQEYDASPKDKVDTLIVLDGTWNKAKKIWHLNPWLQEFNAVRLAGFPASQYRIRQSSVEGSLSTLEAIAYSCNWLSATNEFDQLLKPFKAMIDMQIQKMGEETFLAHYGKTDLDE